MLIREAVSAGWDIEGEFVGPGASPVSSAPAFELADGVLERVASTERPQPNLAVARMRDDPADLDALGFVVVADQLGDPGNLGTILRSSEAAGVEAVVLTPGSVDPFNPKAVRASAGALFHVDVIDATLEAVRSAGLDLVGTSSHRGIGYADADWSGRIAVVLGSEAHGLRDEIDLDRWVKIDHRGRAESLNVAMAATVLVFEAARVRNS